MARPRTPSNVLQARDAFRKNPTRAREDVAGVGEIGPPPAFLSPTEQEIWNEIAQAAPTGVLTATDRISLEVISRLTAAMRETGETHHAAELRKWLGQYGFTASARAKISSAPVKKVSHFDEFLL
jgi:hypothetical protein